VVSARRVAAGEAGAEPSPGVLAVVAVEPGMRSLRVPLAWPAGEGDLVLSFRAEGSALDALFEGVAFPDSSVAAPDPSPEPIPPPETSTR
jgi:hypothetical protein